jgi:hypothetical protein
MAFSAAAQWIATKGGTLDIGHDSEAWTAAYRQLTDRIASGEVACNGVSTEKDQRETLDGALFGSLKVHHMFEPGGVSEWLDRELYLWAVPYIEEDWNAGVSDVLRKRLKTMWTKLMVSRAEIVKWWPFDAKHEIYHGPPRTGAPGAPSTMSYILAEHDHRCDDGIALRSVKREAHHLEAWFKATYKGWPCSTSKTIENRIRDRHRKWRGNPRN